MVSSNPTYEEMKHIVVDLQKRPSIPSSFLKKVIVEEVTIKCIQVDLGLVKLNLEYKRVINAVW